MANQQFAAAVYGDSNDSTSIKGQNHDRHPTHGFRPGVPDEGGGDIYISLGQKMLSAVSGSLITALLGMAIPLSIEYIVSC